MNLFRSFWRCESVSIIVIKFQDISNLFFRLKGCVRCFFFFCVKGMVPQDVLDLTFLVVHVMIYVKVFEP